MVGSERYPHSIPWQVGLFTALYNEETKDTKVMIFCGGVLLSKRFILSAAHCSDYLKASGNSLVLVGGTSLDDNDKDKFHQISNYHIHPKFESFNGESIGIDIFDFMIITLKDSLKNVCPSAFARLPSKGLSEEYLIDKELTISGWGSTSALSRNQVLDDMHGKGFTIAPGIDPFNFPKHLHVVEVPYLRKEICQKRYRNFFVEHQNTQGTKGSFLRDINLAENSGSSMLCTSSCTSENVGDCTDVHEYKGACLSDSGCKCLLGIHYYLCHFDKY